MIDAVVTGEGRVRVQINGPWRETAWASMIATDGQQLFTRSVVDPN